MEENQHNELTRKERKELRHQERTEEKQKLAIQRITKRITKIVLGVDLLQILVGLPLLIIGTCLFTWSYSKNCIQRKIPVEVTPEGKVTRYELTEVDQAEKITHGILFLVFIIIASLIMVV